MNAITEQDERLEEDAGLFKDFVLTDGEIEHIENLKFQRDLSKAKWARRISDFYIGKLLAKQSESLNRTTKWLAFATFGLVIATVGLFFVTWNLAQ